VTDTVAQAQSKGFPCSMRAKMWHEIIRLPVLLFTKDTRDSEGTLDACEHLGLVEVTFS
jgi:hypothetical protein